MRRFTTTYMQYFKKIYDVPSGDSDVRLRFVMQIVDDEDDTSVQFSMSIVAKPMNTLAPIVSHCQLFQGQVATRLTDYLRRVTAELLHPDRASHRQRSVQRG